MSDADFTIPLDSLPERFAESLDRPSGEVAVPYPAATVVLLREGAHGVEVLLLKRVGSAGFVPGAYVFPGGRVDGEDATPALVARLDGLTEEEATQRLGTTTDADPPAVAYYVAAIREAFEETGILIGKDAEGHAPRSAAVDPRMRVLKQELLGNDQAFPSVLDRMGCRMDAGVVEYVGHWITPEAEPRRYDTRFFAALVPPGQDPHVDEREMTEAIWITPEEALRKNRAGELPMVFPTLRTLASLTGFLTPRGALDAFHERDIPTVLPRLVRTPTGVGIEVDEEG